MSLLYEELDYRKPPLGDLMLRRRQSVQLQGLDIYEVKLGDSFLMSNLFHESEVQLAGILGYAFFVALANDNLFVV
ncbi:MAG: hypothetical protein HUN04_21770 [Desulfobacter sp.]|nr:MAG: hypothetical protein HUN04_21770 [Desulfobacter sp.]